MLRFGKQSDNDLLQTHVLILERREMEEKERERERGREREVRCLGVRGEEGVSDICV